MAKLDSQLNLFDSRKSKEARDEALQRVLENAGENWADDAMMVIRGMRGRTVTGEDIRKACLKHKIEPHHHNAWGGFISGLIRKKILLPTGRYVKMKSVTSHARKTELYWVPEPFSDD